MTKLVENKDIYTMLIITIALAVVFLFVLLTFFFSRYADKRHKAKINEESTKNGIYVIDVKNDSVLLFHKSDLRNKKQINLSGFYDLFHHNDVSKVKDWILSIYTQGKAAEEYLEADVISGKSKKNKTNFALFKLVKYDEKDKLIHLESQVLEYITPLNTTAKKRRGNPIGVVKRSQMNQMILKEKSLRGFTFAIRFYYIRQKVLSNDKIERYMTMTLKNEIFPFASNPKNPRQIINDADNEILLFDLRISNPKDAIQLASSIEHSLRKCIGVNGYGDNINFSIGIVQNSQYYLDFEMIVSKAQEACISAQQKGQTTLLYQKTMNQVMEMEKYSQQIDNLLQPGKLRYLFRPIVNISRKRIHGYFQYVKAYDSPFSSVEEMSKYASKVGKNRDLFALIAKNVITKFSSEKPTEFCRLFFSVSLVDLDHIIDILPQIPATKNIKLVLVFEEQEINENSNDLELLNLSLKKIAQEGYELALSMLDRNLLLDPSIYYNFDYFVVGATMVSEVKKNNMVRLSIHNLIEQLLKYKKTIIATDLESWQAVELLVKSGITVLSSEVISASNDMLLPIEKKKMEKLAVMDEHFR